MAYKRRQFELLTSRLLEKRRFIQVLAGPRQSGKTTVAMQVADALEIPVRFVSADDPEALGRVWLEQQWEISRAEARGAGKRGSVLMIDEIQKIPAWHETVKRLWDEDTAKRIPLRALLLGSAPLLIHQGLTESLAGRFEVIRSTHWSFGEMRDAFGMSLDQYVYFGGYPGAADLIKDETRWKRYILDSMVEATLSRDILQLNRIDKPALLRQLFNVACAYSGQILSYTKIVGQLQDAGNTTTLAHYLELLGAAGMTVGLHKYAGQKARQRGSSPKFQVLNGAFLTCQSELSFAQAKGDHAFWGRLVESAVGAHLVNESTSEGVGVFYWREGDKEVDFIVKRGTSLTAIEVKSVPERSARSGMKEFSHKFNPKRKLLVGGDGIRVEEFLGKPLTNWVK
jgi:predicted AAA+ superfamily ATPase